MVNDFKLGFDSCFSILGCLYNIVCLVYGIVEHSENSF